jgi:hypothetical protein
MNAVADGLNAVKRILSTSLVVIMMTAPVCVGDSWAFTLRTAPRVETADVRPGDDLVPPNLFPGSGGDAPAGEKSVKKAVLYSLLLPGLGDYYLGNKGRAYTFFAVEGAIWTSLVVYLVQGHLRENGYKEFAEVFAGISADGHSDEYLKLISRYNTSDDYENLIKSEGRALLFYPDANHDALDAYFVQNRIADYEPWAWTSVDERLKYRRMRSAGKRSYRRALYAGATGLANRAVSIFFAMKSAKEANREVHAFQKGIRVEFGAPWAQDAEEYQTGISFVRYF